MLPESKFTPYVRRHELSKLIQICTLVICFGLLGCGEDSNESSTNTPPVEGTLVTPDEIFEETEIVLDVDSEGNVIEYSQNTIKEAESMTMVLPNNNKVFSIEENDSKPVKLIVAGKLIIR